MRGVSFIVIWLFCGVLHLDITAQENSVEDGLERWRAQALGDDGYDNRVAGMRYRMALLSGQHFAESLAYHEMMFDAYVDLGGVEEHQLMRSWQKLAKVFPEGRASLQQRFERLKMTLSQAEGSPTSMSVFVEMAHLLNCPGEIAALFPLLTNNDKRAVAAEGFFETMVDAGWVAPLGEYVNFEARVSSILKSYRLSNRQMGRLQSGRGGFSLPTGAVESSIRSLRKVYRTLLALQRDEEAANCLREALKISDTPATWETMAWAAYRSGRASEEHLELARRALVAKGGKDPASANTVARLLLTLGNSQAASSLIDSVFDLADKKGRARLSDTRRLIAAVGVSRQ